MLQVVLVVFAISHLNVLGLKAFRNCVFVWTACTLLTPLDSHLQQFETFCKTFDFLAVFCDSPFAREMTYLWRLPHKTPPWKSQKCFHETIMGFNQTQTNSQFSSSSSAVVSQNDEKYFYFLLTLTLFRPELWSFWGGEGANGMRKIFARNWFTLCAALRNNRKLILMSGVNLFSFPKKVCGCSRRVVALLKFLLLVGSMSAQKLKSHDFQSGFFREPESMQRAVFIHFTYIWLRRRELRDFIMLSFSCFLSCTWHIFDDVVIVNGKGGSRQGG